VGRACIGNWRARGRGTRRPLFLLIAAFLLVATLGWSEDGSEADDPSFWQRLVQWRNAWIAASDSYTVSSSGLGYAAFQDIRMNPVIYRGPAFSTAVQNFIYRPKSILLASTVSHMAYPITEKSILAEELYLGGRFTTEMTYFRRFSVIPLAIGGSFSVAGNVRAQDALGNSALNYDIAASISPTIRWEGGFTLSKRPAIWYVQAAVPAFSLILRLPEYNISLGEHETVWALPWQYYGLQLNVGISRLLPHSDENRLTLDYRYDFYGLSKADYPHRLVLGLHSLSVGYAMKTM
jgi:hypothetical protein